MSYGVYVSCKLFEVDVFLLSGISPLSGYMGNSGLNDFVLDSNFGLECTLQFRSVGHLQIRMYLQFLKTWK